MENYFEKDSAVTFWSMLIAGFLFIAAVLGEYYFKGDKFDFPLLVISLVFIVSAFGIKQKNHNVIFWTYLIGGIVLLLFDIFKFITAQVSLFSIAASIALIAYAIWHRSKYVKHSK